MIAIDKKGTKLIGFHPIQESEIGGYTPFEFSVTLIKHRGKFLLVFDKHKNHWEVPGGAVDPGESARDCAVRELQEEANQSVDRLTFNGLISIAMPNG